MRKEYYIIIAEWIITVFLLIKFIPKNKIREANVAFLFTQVITWLTGLAVVELGLIEYPVRLFSYAYKGHFSFEYFEYPAFCAIFNIHYPEEKSTSGKFMYYFYYCTAMTFIEVLLEKYTNIIKYIHWDWYVSWISIFLVFYLSRLYYVWFFRLNKKIDK